MCGIVGFQGGFDTDLLAQMSAVIAQREPDNSDLFFAPEHGFGLAHR
jgi:asparagine synthetase B (glutamine-hydrolysing)